MTRAVATAPGASLRGLAALALALAVPAIALPLGVAVAPIPTALLVLVTAGGIVALRGLGGRMTLWCLFIATIPLRDPLSIDVVGTKTIFLNDIILLPLIAMTAFERGFARIARGSATFRIGVALAVAGVLGLYTATQWVSALNHIYQEIMQVAAFYVAWHSVREARHARWTLLAFVVGMIPSAIYGYYQSTLPVGALMAADGSLPARTWGEDGIARVRPRSTFWHALSFSLGLTVAFAIATGWLFQARTVLQRVTAALLALGFLASNQFTYSLGGLVGCASAVGAAALVQRRRWVFVALPLVGMVWLALAPATFLYRIDKIVSGEHPSFLVRAVAYGQAVQIFRDNPVLGVGWGNVVSEMEGDYRAIRTRTRLQPRAAENYFLQRAMALGGIGLVLVVIACVLFFRNVWTRPPPAMAANPDRWPQAALIIAGVALYVQIQAQPAADPVSRTILWTFLALAERMRMAYRGLE